MHLCVHAYILSVKVTHPILYTVHVCVHNVCIHSMCIGNSPQLSLRDIGHDWLCLPSLNPGVLSAKSLPLNTTHID